MNNALESSASYIKICENRLQEMENSIYSQPPAVREEIGKLTQANNGNTLSNLGDVAYMRRFELQHREEVEVLTRQLMDAEIAQIDAAGKGVTIKVNDFVKGTLSLEHMGEQPQRLIPPKYQEVGKKIKVRVLSVDP